jgi:hypothetical protein
MRHRNLAILALILLTIAFLAILVTRDIVEDPESPEIYGYDLVTSDSLPIGRSIRIRGLAKYSTQYSDLSVFELMTTFPPITIEVYTNKAPSNGSLVEVQGVLKFERWFGGLYLNNANWTYASPIIAFLDLVKSMTITVLPFLIVVFLLLLGVSLIKFLILRRRSKRIDENLGFEYD